ncbi:NADH-ubiquinone oxidoreductase-F iron-sulfur binding region domain-containing protein [Actinomadura fibrosa]|uniref:NADH-ubiquinone oxidoreductase-F iron-sulfur binding region domain-containing protein n=1 Tax=Actinomadura fibrosa TaxID=111802 RepID=A0ABW2XXJ0_9ACTN|nr:NADH-ubiquinone oxidoreductase-F iron-sulfur binding region domain-containing protein [Actinomadura fibrosa]
MTRLLAAATGPDLDAHLRVHGPGPLRGAVRPGQLGPLVEEVAAAGLRGRGGGWFPTSRKMAAVADAVAGAVRSRAPVVVVNAMEGEPLSGKDAHLLDVAPHLVLDGAVLAAEAIGARRVVAAVTGGTLHLRAAERRARGVDPVEVEVRAGPERYLSGQESALVRWINGGPALPSGAVPYEKGVGGRPTLVANAETFAHLALIARRGARWFRSAGSASAPGTALVTVGGDVPSPGVLEVAVGTPVGEVLHAAGVQAPGEGAVLLGGFGGAFLSAGDAAGIPLHPDVLRDAGAALGPGIVSLLAAERCGLAETARIARWMARQGAQQCGPCMFGLPAVASDLEGLAYDGDARALERLHRRLGLLPGRGGCAHPDGTARLIASALAAFRTDVAAHLSGHCLAAVRSMTALQPQNH